MRLDAHQHFWQFDPLRDTWITEEMAVIQRDFLPEDLQPLLEDKGIDGCVAVQADQSLAETDFLLSLAEKHSFVKAVVGWVDLKSDELSSVLERYVGHEPFKGVRHILQAEPDDFMTDPVFMAGVKKLADFGLTYDVLVHQGQLEETLQFIDQLPEMPLVIDHIAKPDIKNDSFDHWAKYMKAIAERKHVTVKVSGLVTEADWKNWKREDFTPYIDFCLEHFGPERLMYGSDWPVCLLAGSYSGIYDLLQSHISQLSDTEQGHIMGGTAAKFYSLPQY